jgi:hypothetical protein
MPIKKTHEKYIKECIEKKLDLPVDKEDNKYKNDRVKLYHKCKFLDHPEYLQTHNNHLSGHGCILCSRKSVGNKLLKSHEQFIKECTEKKVDLPVEREDNKYTGVKNFLYFKCKILNHPEYIQSPDHHLRGKKCPVCGYINRSLSTIKPHEKYIEECIEKKLDLPVDKEDNKYKGDNVKLYHLCTNGHDIYLQTPGSHLRGSGCPICGGKYKKTHEQYLEECKNSKFDLPVDREDNKYEKDNVKLYHLCTNGHEYLQTPGSHLRGSGCQNCCDSKSEKMARQIIEELTNKKFPKCRGKQFPWLQGLELDCYNDVLNIALEYQGIQHRIYCEFFHRGNNENFIKQQERDEKKRKICKDKNIYLIEVPDDINYKTPNKMRLYIQEELNKSNKLTKDEEKEEIIKYEIEFENSDNEGEIY